MEEEIIENYQGQEKMMILVYSQWCINHDLEPEAIYLYLLAYPNQSANLALSEAGEVSAETIMGV